MVLKTYLADNDNHSIKDVSDNVDAVYENLSSPMDGELWSDIGFLDDEEGRVVCP